MSESIIRDYSNFQGVNLALPYTKRSPEMADIMQDAMFLPSGSITARPGWKYRSANPEAIGYECYLPGEFSTKERMVPADRLYRLLSGSFSVSYGGASTGVFITILYDEATLQWRCQVVESVMGTPTEKLNVGLGLGYESSIFDLADLKSAIDGISGGSYTCTITGDTAFPAAYLPLLYQEPFTGSGPLVLAIPFRYRSAVRKPDNGPNHFANTFAARNASDHRNVVGLNQRQIIYFFAGKDFPVKYDGTLAYLMGMKACTITSATPTGVGAITASWNYLARFSHRDAKLNYISGALSDITPASPSSNTSVNLTIPGIATSSGYSTDKAQVNGAQVGVNTITVDAGFTLQNGDYVTLFDRSLSGYAARQAVYRKITGVTATTITIDGAPLNVSDNDIISQCLVLEVYRTKSTGSVFYAHSYIPVDSSLANITVVDTIADSALGEEFEIPLNFADPPPMGGIATSHQGLVVISRISGYPNRIAWEDPQLPEGFPSDVNFREVFSSKGGSITGLWSNEAGLDIFYQASSRRIYGTLFDGQLESRPVSARIGMPHHHCGKELDNGYFVYITPQGFRQIGPGGKPIRVGASLDSLFKRQKLRTGNRKYVLERSLVVDNPLESMCYFFLNCETSSTERYTNGFSEVWVLDYQFEDYPRWVGPWKNINMAGGAFFDPEEQTMTWIERRLNDLAGGYASDVIDQNIRKDDFDQIDHNVALDWEWDPGFDDLGTKFVKKIYERMQLYSSDPQNLAGFTVLVKVEKNYNAGVEVSNFMLALGKGGDASGFGFDPFGQFAFGNPIEPDVEEVIPNTKNADNAAGALRLTFSHSSIFARPIISCFGMLVKVPYSVGNARK